MIAAFMLSALSLLPGHWLAKGKVAGHEKTVDIQAEFVLGGKYVHIHERDLSGGSYEADVYIGIDDRTGQCAAHWLDLYGPALMTSIGHGEVRSTSIDFTFHEPDGLVRNIWTWQNGEWHWIIVQHSNKKALWKVFADQHLTPVK